MVKEFADRLVSRLCVSTCARHGSLSACVRVREMVMFQLRVRSRCVAGVRLSRCGCCVPSHVGVKLHIPSQQEAGLKKTHTVILASHKMQMATLSLGCVLAATESKH